MIKGTVHQEDIMTRTYLFQLEILPPNIQDRIRRRNGQTHIVGDFDTFPSVADRVRRQNICKAIEDLSNTKITFSFYLSSLPFLGLEFLEFLLPVALH